MTHWHIRTGDLVGSVEADSHEKAFLRLLNSEKPESLGKIYQACKVTSSGKLSRGSTIYASVEATLRRVGLWEKEKL